MCETSILGIPNMWVRENKILISVLNDWEKEFLSSIYKWCRYKGSRSIKQQKVFEKLRWKSRLEKIPNKLPDEKPEINLNINISHEKSVKIVEFVVKICGKAWDSYTIKQQEFLKDIMIQIQKPGAKLDGIQYQKIKEIINITKKRNSRYQKYVGRNLSKKFTEKTTGSSKDTLKIIAIKDTRRLAVLCSLSVKLYSQSSYNIEILEDIWVPISQIYSPKRSRLYE